MFQLLERWPNLLFKPGKRQTWICTTWRSFPFTCLSLFRSCTKNDQFHIIIIHRNCLGLFSLASFLFWDILNLPFAVTVTLNLFVLKACASAVSDKHTRALLAQGKWPFIHVCRKFTKKYVYKFSPYQLLANDDFGFSSS